MEEFKKSIKTRLTRSIISTVAAIGIVLLCYVNYKISGITGHVESFMRGYQTGLVMAGVLLGAMHIYNLCKALKSEERLRKMYIKESDERDRAIKNKIAYTGFWTTVPTLLVASIAAGFYSITVFVTLMSVLLFMLVIALIYKCVYYKIM